MVFGPSHLGPIQYLPELFQVVGFGVLQILTEHLQPYTKGMRVLQGVTRRGCQSIQENQA